MGLSDRTSPRPSAGASPTGRTVAVLGAHDDRDARRRERFAVVAPASSGIPGAPERVARVSDRRAPLGRSVSSTETRFNVNQNRIESE